MINENQPIRMTGKGEKDFLGKPAPLGYIPGLNRQGFVTRSDLGPGSNISNQPKLVNGIPTVGPSETADDEEFNENEEGLLAVKGPMGADDEEADSIYAQIEFKMNQRRKAKTKVNAPVTKDNNPHTMFAKEKLLLREVRASEWANLPESGDFIAKRVKKTNEKELFTPLPDSLIVPSSMSFGSGTGSSVNFDGTETDFRSVGEAKERVLGAKLDMLGTDTGRTTSVDPVGYLTSLESSASQSLELNDIKKARLLLRNAVQTNPQNPSAWISLAKIEEVAKNLKAAKSAIMEAVEKCPDSEDVWLESIRLHTSPVEKSQIAERATKSLPKSPNLWLKWASVEKELSVARKILRSGLEENMECVKLWKALIEKEEDAEDARVLLAKAVEYCPKDIELWIALARLEDHLEARKVLNKARQYNPLSTEIWLAAARLEEANGNQNDMVEKIIIRAKKELEQREVLLSRKEWMKLAMECEDSGDVLCTRTIVKLVAPLGYEDLTKEEMAEHFVSEARDLRSNYPILAESLLRLTVDSIPKCEEAWLILTDLPHLRGPVIFNEAINICQTSENLYLQYVEFLKPNSAAAAQILNLALKTVRDSENLWLVLSDLYLDDQCFDEALNVLARGSQILSNSEILSSRYLNLAYRLGVNITSDLAKAMEIFPKSESLWILKSKTCSTGFDWEKCLNYCPNSSQVYILAALYTLERKEEMRSRAILERARKIFPNDEGIWYTSINIEKQLNATSQAKILLNKALLVCPVSDILWREAIDMEPRPTKRSKVLEALRKCGSSSIIFIVFARLLEEERNFDSARDYYERAIKLDEDNGDSWACFIRFLRRLGEDEQADEILKKCIKTIKPRKGIEWKRFRESDEWWRIDYPSTFEAFAKFS